MTTAYPLYDPRMEHESCGVGAVVDLGKRASHRTVSDALTIVERLAHRAGSQTDYTHGIQRAIGGVQNMKKYIFVTGGVVSGLGK